MNSFLLKAQTAYALGAVSLWRVASYKLGVKLGLNPVKQLSSEAILDHEFYYLPEKTQNQDLTINTAWFTQHYYFGWFKNKSTDPPNWHQNPFNKQSVQYPDKNWWEIPDFDTNLGDIKTVWEASRFDWMLGFAQAASQGDSQALSKLNTWLGDWCQKNPFYKGVNWKCGQEASIRVMHLCIAAALLNQHQSPSASLVQLIKAHLKRIAPTIGYAMAQNNNHGTSEAAALFIGGSWLHSLDSSDNEALQYCKKGGGWLENRAKALIADDGTFSQYSLNYHRLMLDTYSMAEYWRRLMDLDAFSNHLITKLQAATNWLYQMVQTGTGDAPNLGANDGARLLPLTDTDYRDYRPSVQLASVLFSQQRAYPTKGSWDLPCQWLNIALPEDTQRLPSYKDFSNSGYSLLRQDTAFVLFNIPRFKFRPSQCDALHLDFWLNGENILRDGGTYSYNSSDQDINYFAGTASHNTIQFDGREQMPRISRFLLGAWLKAKEIIPVSIQQDGCQYTAASYTDYQGSYHHRSISLYQKKLIVIDSIKGVKQSAVLRWRLKSDNWIINKKEKTLTNNALTIKIKTSLVVLRFELTEGWESRYYMKKIALPVLEIEVNTAGTITTEIIFNQ